MLKVTILAGVLLGVSFAASAQSSIDFVQAATDTVVAEKSCGLPGEIVLGRKGLANVGISPNEKAWRNALKKSESEFRDVGKERWCAAYLKGKAVASSLRRAASILAGWGDVDGESGSLDQAFWMMARGNAADEACGMVRQEVLAAKLALSTGATIPPDYMSPSRPFNMQELTTVAMIREMGKERWCAGYAKDAAAADALLGEKLVVRLKARE